MGLWIKIIKSLATGKGKNVVKDTIKKFSQTDYNIATNTYIKQLKNVAMSDNQIISKARAIYTNYKAKKGGKNVVDIKTGKSISSKKQYGGPVTKAQYDT